MANKVDCTSLHAAERMALGDKCSYNPNKILAKKLDCFSLDKNELAGIHGKC